MLTDSMGGSGWEARQAPDAFSDGLRQSRIGIEEKDGEFVAAKTRGNFGGATMFLHDAGEPLQRLISTQVAEAVVDGLQIVQIQEAEERRAGRCGRRGGLRVPVNRQIRDSLQGRSGRRGWRDSGFRPRSFAAR